MIRINKDIEKASVASPFNPDYVAIHYETRDAICKALRACDAYINGSGENSTKNPEELYNEAHEALSVFDFKE